MTNWRASTALALFLVAGAGVLMAVLAHRVTPGSNGGGPAEALVDAARVVVQTGSVPRVLRESSGVAVSRRHPGVLWSHNDSGFPPVLHAIGLDGRVIGEVAVRGAKNVDWEDLALGSCPPRSGATSTDCLYIGDIGDNAARRDHVVVYVVAEPDPARDSTPVLAALRISYPEGAEDAESLAIDTHGNLTIVTKGRSGSMRLLGVPATAWERLTNGPGTYEAETLGNLTVTPDFRQGRQATGAAVAPSGRWLAVRTYREVYFLARSEKGWALDGNRCYLWGREPQGEAVDFLDEQTLVLTSEAVGDREGTILRVRCEGATPVDTVPPASPNQEDRGP
jgi:hypothetical protein